MDNNDAYRNRLYTRYISTHFGKIHDNSPKEFEVYNRYFKKNYSAFLPEDKNAKILDAGCGTGHFLYFLEKEGYGNYLGIDISDENIEYCRGKNFNIKKYDIFEFLRDSRERFDLIVLNDIIEHFSRNEVPALMDLLYKNLKIGGKVIVKTANCSNPITGASSRYCNFTHLTGFTEESLAQVLEICNFKAVKIYPQDIFVFYTNPINYLARFTQALLNISIRLLFRLYGRKSTKIFTKSMVGIGFKA